MNQCLLSSISSVFDYANKTCSAMFSVTASMASCIFICLALNVQSVVALELESEALIYPQRSDVTVAAHSDLRLGCRGAEPMRWTFQDDHNGPNFNTSDKNITNLYNETVPEYKFETLLTVYNVSRINIGFYHCHGEAVFFHTARRSSKIYVFVRDEKDLSVTTSGEVPYLAHEWATFIPCRPTSEDITITLFRDKKRVMSVNPSNYSAVHKAKNYEISFHSYHGFTMHHLRDDHRKCMCTFTRNNKIVRIQLPRLVAGFYTNNMMYIEGPASADVGDDISLQCTFIASPYFQYYKYWPKWDAPISGNERTENLQVLHSKHVLVLINILTIKNVSTEDEGEYSCQFKYYASTFSGSEYVFVKEKRSNDRTPRIYYPKGDEEQINSGENITLRCAGSRPVSWTVPYMARLEKNTYYNQSRPDLRKDIYESYLHITKTRYTNTGLYSCYESDSMDEHPHKSASFFIFVRDENHLYIPAGRFITYMPYTNVTVSCLPTSRDANVSLSIVYKALDPISSRYGPKQEITPVIHAYDPRKGFTVQMPGPGRGTANCTFVTETRSDTLDITIWSDFNLYLDREPFITGPAEDLVFLGQTLELSCSVFVFHNVPDDVLRWTSPNNVTSSEVTTEMKRINVEGGKVLINKLRIHEVTNAGRYFCQLTSNNATAGKFISVYDQIKVGLLIENLQYTYAYIGQPLVLRCKVNITHNVGFQMSWTTPNVTEIKVKYTDIKFIPNTRNTCGESILTIDSITEENGGNYSCNVFYSTNRRNYTTKTIMVKKGEKPRIVSNQEQIVVRLQEPADLTCVAEGDPEPVITWLKNSTEVKALGIGLSVNNSTLTVHSAQRVHAGLYTCIAQNPFGRVSRTVYLHVQTVLIPSEVIGAITCLIIGIVVASVFLVVRKYREKKLLKKLNEADFILFNSGEIQCLNPLAYIAEQTPMPYDTKWEIPRSSIKLGRNLGSGCFGLVVEATVSNFFDGEPKKTVAVKMLHRYRNIMEVNSLICELKIMCHLGQHINLINLLGACTENLAEGKLLVLIEYCENGCLGNYLIKNRTNFINLIDPDTELISLPADYDESLQESRWSGVDTLQLLRWALHVARGMEFLAARQLLHGDLAARNILLDANYVAKICDFGMSKTLSSSGYYKKKSRCPLPVKWMAIESIRDKTFSTQSDVWAFGVVVWELFSLARTPYAELEPDFRFYRKLASGYRLDRPEYSTKEIYQVMRECWSAQPQCRPTFSYLVSTLTDRLQEPIKRHFLQYSQTRTNEILV